MEYPKIKMSRVEKAVYDLRGLYESFGYTRFKVNKFEEYDFYAGCKSFLSSGNILTFTDTGGRLMALKPDITLSIVKNAGGADDDVKKLYYNESVYRDTSDGNGFREITQCGLECVGNIDLTTVCEVISLAQKSLAAISPEYILDISHMGLLSGILEGESLGYGEKNKIAECVSEKNLSAVKELCRSYGISDKTCDVICQLSSLYIRPEEASGTLRDVFSDWVDGATGSDDGAYEEDIRFCSSKCTAYGKANGPEKDYGSVFEDDVSFGDDSQSYDNAVPEEGDDRRVKAARLVLSAVSELEEICAVLSACGCSEHVRLDFSAACDMKYYSGIIFRGYVKGVPRGILSGGRYDSLIRVMGRTEGALGFAVYPDQLEYWPEDGADNDADILLVYGKAKPAEAMRRAEQLRASGFSVRTSKKVPADGKFGVTEYFERGGEVGE